MAISYHIIEKGEPGVPGGGDTKFYASAQSTGEVDIDQLTRRIEKISTVSGADIRAVLYALIDVAPEELADGNIVRLGDLGYFRISISSNGHQQEDEVGTSSIRKARIIFTPGPRFKSMLNNLEYKKIPTN